MNKSYVLDHVITEGFDTNESIRANGVYKIYHESKPEWIYIGSASVTKRKGGKMTIGFHCRFIEHLSKLRANKHHSKLLQRVVNKYGISGVKIDIIEIVDPEDCLNREQYYIDILKPKYNTFKKVILSSGYSLSEEQKNKISNALKGRIVPQDVRCRISKSLKGIYRDTSHLRTKEVREKITAKMKGRVPSKKCIESIEKKIYMYSMDGCFMSEFSSIEKASNETNIDRASISKSASGKRRSAGGFRWSFFKKPCIGQIPSVRILKYSLQGDLITEYPTLKSAAESVGSSSINSIRSCILGKQKHAYGFYWARDNGYLLNSR